MSIITAPFHGAYKPAAAGGVGLPVTDNFNRADNASSLGTATSGHVWVPVASAGVWGINSNQAYLPTANNQSVIHVDGGAADVTVEVTVLTSDSSDNIARQGLAFRFTDSSNYFWLYYINNFVLRCYKLVAGVDTMLFTVNRTAADGDVLKVVTLGDQIEVYLNGSLETTITESHNQTATKHGLFWQNGGAGASIARWEDFSII